MISSSENIRTCFSQVRKIKTHARVTPDLPCVRNFDDTPQYNTSIVLCDTRRILQSSRKKIVNCESGLAQTCFTLKSFPYCSFFHLHTLTVNHLCIHLPNMGSICSISIRSFSYACRKISWIGCALYNQLYIVKSTSEIDIYVIYFIFLVKLQYLH